VLLAVVLGACQPQHYGASVLNQSNAWSPAGTYEGPVYATPGDADGNPEMDAHVDEQSGAIVVTDFEHNMLSDGSWDEADHNTYFSMVFKRERCTVVVLGWKAEVGPTDPLLVARGDIQDMVSIRTGLGYPTIVVDWRDVVVEHPEYLAADGVHLASAEAAEAFAALINNGIAGCP
jgi:hypothetical protein